MDVIGDALAIMRTGRPRSMLLEYHAPWGRRFPYSPGSAAFQVVLQGSAWLIPRAGDLVPLNVGDVVFLPHGHDYAIADSPITPLGPASCLQEDDLYASVSY